MRIGDGELRLSAPAGARALALGLLAEADEAAERLAAGAADDALHDFRVALRRLRSALRALRPWVEDAVPRRHERRLRKIARSTSEARDAEVQLAWLAARREVLLAPTLRAGRDLLVARLERRGHRGSDRDRVIARYRRVGGKLARRLRAHEPEPEDDDATFGCVLASLVAERVAALRERMDEIRSAADEEAAHRARIEGKRLRYLLEPLRGCRGADASAVIGRLKRLQDVLGELHDAHVLSAELRGALLDAAAERARRLHAAVYGPDAGSVREALGSSPRPGLIAILRLVRERRDALHAELERDWRAGGVDALAAEAGAIAAALDGLSRRAG